MSGIGHLRVRQGDATIAMWAIHEGSAVMATLNGNEFSFSLERAPLPSEFDIRRLDSTQLAQALVDKLKAEESEREQDAIEEREWAE